MTIVRKSFKTCRYFCSIIMFRQIIVMVIMVALATQTFNKAFIFIDYLANTNAFVRNCENQLRPQLKCAGKCQMMKKMVAEEKKEKQNPERKLHEKNDVISSRSFFITAGNSFREHKTQGYGAYLSPRPIARSYGIFHPPA